MGKVLSTLKSVPIRDIWPNEAGNFTPWLAQPENMDRLGAELGISFGPVQQEASVGSYRVDIFTTENSTEERKVIIENQYETTDHDHLGKIITYASGKDAKTVIWIAEQVRDEHRSAIQWLNEHTDEDVGFFLIKIKVVRIDDSNPAPIFEIVESPNDWERKVRARTNLEAGEKKRLEFWDRFVDYASKNERFFEEFRKHKTSPKSVYDLAFGDNRYHFFLSNLGQKGRKGFAITLYSVNQKDLYDHLKSQAAEIEREIGAKLNWQEAKSGKSRTIRWMAPDEVAKSEQSIFDWYIAAAYKFKAVFAKYAN